MHPVKPKVFTIWFFICYSLTYTSCLSLILSDLLYVNHINVLAILPPISNMFLSQGLCISYSQCLALPRYPYIDGHLHLLLVFVQMLPFQ